MNRECAGEADLRKLDSSVKRNTALVKKLRQVGEESRQALLDDIGKTNQSKVRLHSWPYTLCYATLISVL